MTSKIRSQSAWSYVTVFSALLILRIVDLYLTYRLTPDLSSEWNPLISHLELSWGGFIGAQVALVLFAVAGYHRYAQRIRNPVEKPGLALLPFVYHYFNGHDYSRRKWIGSFFKLPDKRTLKTHGAFVGFVIIASFLLTSVFAIVHNFLIFHGNRTYLEFVLTHSSAYVPSVFITLVVLSANVFFVLEYRNYRRFNET